MKENVFKVPAPSASSSESVPAHGLPNFAAGRLGSLSEAGAPPTADTTHRKFDISIPPPANHAESTTAGSISVQYVHSTNLLALSQLCTTSNSGGCRSNFIHHGRLSSYSAHAQVHPQPSPRTSSDGRVSLPGIKNSGHVFVVEVESDGNFCIAMSSTPTAPTFPRTSSVASSVSSTRPRRTMSPSSVSRHTLVAARAPALPSSTTAPRP